MGFFVGKFFIKVLNAVQSRFLTLLGRVLKILIADRACPKSKWFVILFKVWLKRQPGISKPYALSFHNHAYHLGSQIHPGFPSSEPDCWSHIGLQRNVFPENGSLEPFDAMTLTAFFWSNCISWHTGECPQSTILYTTWLCGMVYGYHSLGLCNFFSQFPLDVLCTMYRGASINTKASLFNFFFLFSLVAKAFLEQFLWRSFLHISEIFHVTMPKYYHWFGDPSLECIIVINKLNDKYYIHH